MKSVQIDDKWAEWRAKEKVEMVWQEYVKNLYEDRTRTKTSPGTEGVQLDTAPDIMMNELEYAIQIANINKRLTWPDTPTKSRDTVPSKIQATESTGEESIA